MHRDHILTIDPGTYSVTHVTPANEPEQTEVCRALQVAVDVFMTPARPRFRHLFEYLTEGRPFPRMRGSFWIELAPDGNLEIGSRLTEAERKEHVAWLTV